ncbi:hypothetical protein G6F57_021730 [Rhizopus arrhizus]|nr:hypothetical protein G6F24_018351 [Rhizopus arrhizus]KAG1434128.1 hypothetical protein G6F57_021730 [Rhizopus arrhizus]
MPSTEETDSRSKAGSTPRQKDPGADTRNGQGTPGGKTGAPDNAGMPGSGASSGSGGGADPRSCKNESTAVFTRYHCLRQCANAANYDRRPPS